MIQVCTHLSPAPLSVRLWYRCVLTFHPLLSQCVYDTGVYSTFTRSFLSAFMIQVCTHLSPASFWVRLWYRCVLTFHPLLSQYVYDAGMYSLFTRSFLSASMTQICTHLSPAPFSVRLWYRYVLTFHPLLSQCVYYTGVEDDQNKERYNGPQQVLHPSTKHQVDELNIDLSAVQELNERQMHKYEIWKLRKKRLLTFGLKWFTLNQ